MLRGVTGTDQFDEKLNKIKKALDDVQVKKQTLQSVLTEIEAKLAGLSVDKEAYKEIEEVELKKKAYQRMLYKSKVDKHQAEANSLKGQKALLMQERELLIQQREA